MSDGVCVESLTVLGAIGPGFAEWAELVSMMFAEYQMKQRLFCVRPALHG